jgi:D-glycero-D-manno-heptose 1,7-bisphosphate phosphatase
MIVFHGKPFAEYLVEMLAAQGIDKIVFLLGYLPEVVQNHFSDGRRWGVRIEYGVSSPETLTGSRIRLARSLLDDTFLLLYCDNYWPLQLDTMWRRFSASGARAMVTVYRNIDGIRKSNIRMDEEGYVQDYDRTRSRSGLQGVEIGYAIVHSTALEFLTEEDRLFEDAVYPELIRRRQLLAFPTDHRYYSVGSLDRLRSTADFLERRPAIILDRDGVLNTRPRKGEYVRHVDEFTWLPGARDALRLLKDAGYTIIVVSNQAGIARGALTTEDLERIHQRMRRQAEEAGGAIDAVYYCPHHWDDGCNCRKPQPGMIFQAQRDFNLDLSRTFVVGDDERDIQASEAAGCPSVFVGPELSLLDVVTRTIVPPGRAAFA